MNVILIVGALVVILGVVLCILKKGQKIFFALPILGIAIALFSQAIVIIPTGYTGVRITFGQVDETVVPQGFSFKAPFIQSVARVNNKQQEVSLATDGTTIESTISGKIPISMSDIGVTYQINSDKSSYIYKTVSNPDNLVSYDLISSAVKSSTTEFDADSVVVRTEIEPILKEKLQTKIDDKYGEGVVTIIQVTIGDISFSDEYNAAINNKNIAKQEAEQQEIINQKNIDQANAEAEALLIEAQAEKEANNLKETSLTDRILMQQYIEKWNGELPKVTGSESNMIDIGSLLSNPDTNTSDNSTTDTGE